MNGASARCLAAILATIVSGCSSYPGFDSCSRQRHFRQFTLPSRAYYALPAVDVASLPPEVREAVAARMRVLAGGDEPFEILAAHASGRYLLLAVRPACFDCDRWLVYSKPRRCIVGYFIPATQG